MDGILTLYDVSFQRTYTQNQWILVLPPWQPIEKLQFKRSMLISRFKIWAMSASLAVTKDILVSFFSSA